MFKSVLDSLKPKLTSRFSVLKSIYLVLKENPFWKKCDLFKFCLQSMLTFVCIKFFSDRQVYTILLSLIIEYERLWFIRAWKSAIETRFKAPSSIFPSVNLLMRLWCSQTSVSVPRYVNV